MNATTWTCAAFSGLDDTEYDKVVSALKKVLEDLKGSQDAISKQSGQGTLQATDAKQTGPEPPAANGSAKDTPDTLLSKQEQAKQQSIPAELKEKLLALLPTGTMESRRINLPPAHEESCQWFYDTFQYKSWRDPTKLGEYGGFSWIRGNPGTGKSVLMNFLSNNACKQADDDEIILSFFFFAQGSMEPRTSIGLYRFLLHKLFDTNPHIIMRA